MIWTTSTLNPKAHLIAAIIALTWFVGTLDQACAAVTSIGIGDFSDPATIDFEASTSGAISGSDSIFTNVGISNVSATGSTFGDIYDLGYGVGKSLFASSPGLAVLSPGDAQPFFTAPTFTLEFTSPQSRFGFSVSDHASMNFLIEFYSGPDSVGQSNVFIPVLDFSTYSFESTIPFDRVEISAGPDGYGLDSIVVDIVPEPSAWVLMLLGCAILGFGHLKRRNNQSSSQGCG